MPTNIYILGCSLSTMHLQISTRPDKYNNEILYKVCKFPWLLTFHLLFQVGPYISRLIIHISDVQSDISN